ncbi:DNA replication licensing factor mcm8 [Sparganum proliferum]
MTPYYSPQDSKPKKFFRKCPYSKKRNPPLSEHVYPDDDSGLGVCAPPPSITSGPIVLGSLPKFCPYPGWLLYFPEKAFDSADPAVKMTEAFVSYIKQSCLSSSGPESIDWSAVEETQTIHVDYPSLLTSESLKKRIADWPTDANGESPPNARVILQSLGLAVHTVASRQIDMDSAPGKEFLHPWLRVHHSQLGFVAVRLLGHFPTLPMRSLRANHLGRLVSIRGTVARLGPIKPLCIRLAFRCLVCENEQVLVLGEDGCFIQPTKCPEKGCRSKSFVPLFESASTRVVDTRIFGLFTSIIMCCSVRKYNTDYYEVDYAANA